jgi:MoaA/NifB/PqqE/SkfB family radical SAM enzyme
LLYHAGLKQVNIHKLLAKETLQSCFDLIDKVTIDVRLCNLKAIVFLLLKPKGSRNRLTPIQSLDDYKRLLEYAQSKGVAVGMDSCSAPMALRSLPASGIPSVEPCESTAFSLYINVRGEVFPCSFTEGTPGWESGVRLADVQDFVKEVWHGERLKNWRSRLLASSSDCNCDVKQHCRSCPVYDVTVCKNQLVQIGE